MKICVDCFALVENGAGVACGVNNSRIRCWACEASSKAKQKELGSDVVGKYPNGQDKLRKHLRAGIENAAKKRYANGRAGAYFVRRYKWDLYT